MLNSKPNNKKYHQGNFIPVNKDKVYKMNNQGGVFYRSSWEYKIMKWLDMNESIVIWGAECFEIPYEMTHFEAGDFKIKNHRYYPDFFYKMKMSDGSINLVARRNSKNNVLRGSSSAFLPAVLKPWQL